jgi:Cys-tRNA(Pro)/Cys-tRNA(Cys) deacylase
MGGDSNTIQNGKILLSATPLLSAFHRRMTPAIQMLKKAGVSFEIREYRHDPRAESYGLEAAAALGVPPEQVFKTLITKLDTRELVVAIIPVHKSLDLKALAAAAGAKKTDMAEVTEAERATGYVKGGISPLGQRKKLRTIVDESIQTLERVFVSAGRRGMDLELRPIDLLRLCQAITAAIVK